MARGELLHSAAEAAIEMTSGLQALLAVGALAICALTRAESGSDFARIVAPAPILTASQRQDILKREVVEAVDKYRKKIADPAYDPESRELAIYARYVLALGGKPAEAEAALRRTFSAQVPEGDPHAGNFYWWERKRAEKLDENAMSFIAQELGPILLAYRDKLSPEFVAEAMSSAKALVAAMRKRAIVPDYTNICLLDVTGMLLLGEALDDDAAVKEAGERLESWIAFTRREGITEYNSPIYSAVQVGAVETAYNYARDEGLKKRLGQVLDLLWAEAAGAYFPDRAGILAPPYSRNGNYILGRGSIEQYFFSAGLTDRLVEKTVFGGWGRTWLNEVANGYRPGENILALAKTPERWVQGKFGTKPGHGRSMFITPDFALGSASAFYAMDDLQLGAALPDGKSRDLPLVSIILDSGDAPYGKSPRPNALGHNKSYHLSNAIAAVQSRGTVLALLRLDAGSRGPAETVATNLQLPLEAEAVYVDGSMVKAADFEKTAVTPASIVAVRQGRGVVAARFFAVEGLEGQQPGAMLRTDGKEWKAGRFAIYHYKGAERKFARAAARTGVLLAAAAVDNETQLQAFLRELAEAKITSSVEGGLWTAKAEFRGTELSTGLDLAKGEVAFRQVDGVEQSEETFVVNGENWTEKCLGPK